MWKCLVVLVLVQRNILSQPVNHENIREARHLNFEECCPCPSSDRRSVIEQESWDNQVPRDCPCKTASDSDTASSILRPAMRAVEPFIRPTKTNSEPKLLLRPEVGLASSVLETLREVTDQEYQDALARDAARSEIDAAEPNSMNQLSPRNIVNIILKPKNDNIDDVIPEASHVQETRFIQPSFGKSSRIDDNRLQFNRNTFLPLSKVPSSSPMHKKIFDMDNSASNLQQQILQPLRSNLLDDLKLKSDLLKTKLFPSISNSLGVARPHLSTEIGKDRNFRLPSLLDHIKIQKENDILTMSSSTKNIDRHREADIISSPSKLQKYVYSNTQSSNFKNKPDIKKNNLNIKHPHKMNNLSTKPESTLLYNTNDRSDIDITELSDKNDCNTYNGIENNDFINVNNVQTLDAASSPSEVSDVTSSVTNDLSQINENDDCDIIDEKNINDETNSLGDDIQHTHVEDVVSSRFDELFNEENPDIIQLNSVSETVNNNVKDESLCDVKDVDASASNNIPENTNLDESGNENVLLDNVNEARSTNQLNVYEQRSIDENISRIIEDNVTVNDTRKLPNIKGNILKTLENFKKTNERIQEKLKANVQDALQSLNVKKNPVVEIESPLGTDDLTKIDINNKNNKIPTIDLQEMSNRILNLSNIKEDEKLRFTSQSRENEPNDIKYKDNDKHSTDNHVRLSELDDISKTLYDFSFSSKIRNSGIIKSENNNQILKNVKSKTLDDPCVKLSKSSNLIESDIDLDRNEMITQASSPIISSTHHLVQPKNFNVKTALDNFKTTVTDLFNTQRESQLLSSYNDSENDNTLINAMYEKNAKVPEIYLPRTNKDQRLDLHPKTKSSDSNLKSYRAKIPVPASINREYYRGSTEDNAPFNTLQNQMDISSINLKKFVGNTDKHKILGSKSQVLNTLRNAPLSTDNYHFKSHNVLKNIQDTLDLPMTRPVFRNRNNLLGKASPGDILGAIAKSNNDLNEKFKTFHLELNDKLSSFSQKISDLKPLQLKTEPRFRNIKSNGNSKMTKLPNGRDNTSVLTATKSSLNLNNPQSSSKIIDLRKPKLVKKIQNPTQVTLDSNKSPSIAYSTKLDNDINKRKRIKSKPFRDNKVTVMFTTTIRPSLTLKRKSPQSSKMADIKSSEPRTSASESVLSRVPFSNKGYKAEEPDHDEQAPIYKLSLHTKGNSDSEETDRRKAAKSVISKIREAVKGKAKGSVPEKNYDNNMLRSGTDEVLSASDLNPVSLKDRSLKENVSYKCKMMCFEDHDNA